MSDLLCGGQFQPMVGGGGNREIKKCVLEGVFKVLGGILTFLLSIRDSRNDFHFPDNAS